jgi:hypothetical protein
MYSLFCICLFYHLEVGTGELSPNNGYVDPTYCLFSTDFVYFTTYIEFRAVSSMGNALKPKVM